MGSFLTPPPRVIPRSPHLPKNFPSFHKLSKASKVFGPRPKTLEMFGSLALAARAVRGRAGELRRRCVRVRSFVRRTTKRQPQPLPGAITVAASLRRACLCFA